MLIISVYSGGEVLNTSTGVDYSTQAVFSFTIVDPKTPLSEIKREIYNNFGLLESQSRLKIRLRYNAGSLVTPRFQLIPITNQNVWDTLVTHILGDETFCTLETVVDILPRTDGTHTRRIRTSNTNSSVQEFLPESSNAAHLNEDSEDEFDCAGVTNPDDGEEDDPIYEDSGDIPDQPDEEDNEEDDEVDEPPTAPRYNSSSSNPFVSRRDKHPVAEFHDISGFSEADITFFGAKRQFDGEIDEGRTFNSKNHLQKIIYQCHIRTNTELEITHSSKSKYVAKCAASSTCKFRIYAKPTGNGEMWEIATNKYPHTCRGSISRVEHRQLTARLIASTIQEDLRANLEMNIATIRCLIGQAYPEVQATYNKLWRGREVAIADLFGSWETSYGLLRPLLDAIQRNNPGTMYKLESINIPGKPYVHFDRVVWAFGPSIASFRHLRPVISIDAAHLSGRYAGKLFIACGYDAENQLFPLAFAIVAGETNENWGWFMKWLRYNVVGWGKICVVSDRHVTIRNVFLSSEYGWSESLGQAVHRFCVQHIAQNYYKRTGSKKLAGKFKWFSRKKKPRKFENAMQELSEANPGAYEYLLDIGNRTDTPLDQPLLHLWAQSKDEGYRWGIMTTNGSESLNNVFRVSRMLPVCAIVEATFYKISEWFANRKQKTLELQMEGYVFSSRITSILERRARKAKNFEVSILSLDPQEYEIVVRNEYFRRGLSVECRYQVCLASNSPTCTCQKPQLIGIPCEHVIAVCQKRRFCEKQFVNKYYTIDVLLETWTGRFASRGNNEDWPIDYEPIVRPDRRMMKKGRRRHKRIPMAMDELEGRIANVETADRIN